MIKENKISVFLVDDDALFLKTLEIDFILAGEYNIATFATGELCLLHIKEQPDLIVLDYHLNGVDKKAMTGIEVIDRIKSQHPEIPVVILSSQDKIEVAVNCMHHNALDYVVKSETAFLRLHKIIDNMFRYKKIEHQLSWYMERM